MVTFRQERLWSCFHCGQCMAVCPTGSIQISGLSYECEFFPLPQRSADEYADFSNLIASRRAVRSYQKRPVPRELLMQVVDAIRFSPPGFPPVKTELTVVTDPDLMRRSLPLMIAVYDPFWGTVRTAVRHLAA